MTELIEQCLGLPIQERMSLYEALKESILRELGDRTQPSSNRGRILLGYLGEIMGEPIPVKDRTQKYVWARAMVAYQLVNEGHTTHETGRMIGKDHACVVYLKHKMQDALKYEFAYRDVVDIWKQFQNKIQDEIHRTTT